MSTAALPPPLGDTIGVFTRPAGFGEHTLCHQNLSWWLQIPQMVVPFRYRFSPPWAKIHKAFFETRNAPKERNQAPEVAMRLPMFPIPARMCDQNPEGDVHMTNPNLMGPFEKSPVPSYKFPEGSMGSPFPRLLFQRLAPHDVGD